MLIKIDLFPDFLEGGGLPNLFYQAVFVKQEIGTDQRNERTQQPCPVGEAGPQHLSMVGLFFQFQEGTNRFFEGIISHQVKILD